VSAIAALPACIQWIKNDRHAADPTTASSVGRSARPMLERMLSPWITQRTQKLHRLT
jgi:hypothetical protein